MGEHLLTDEHFVEDETSAPDIALLVVLFEFEHFGGCVEGRASSLGHLHLHVAGESEVGDLEFLILVEENVVGLEISVQFVYVEEWVLSLLM
jgi:hypothetical protein